MYRVFIAKQILILPEHTLSQPMGGQRKGVNLIEVNTTQSNTTLGNPEGKAQT